MRHLLTIILVLTQLWGYAQITISGKVMDKNEVLIGANVYLVGTYTGATTDVNGSYKFESTLRDSQLIKVEYMGYTSVEKWLFLEDKDIEVDFVLTEAFNKLKAVTISAGAFEAGDKKKTVVLNSIDMATTAGALGDVTGALMTLPGTTTVGESGKLFVRGGESDESKTFVDGTQVYKPYNSSAPNLSTRGRFSPFMFEGTVFSTGGYSAEYGEALSSVLLLNTKGLQAKDALNISMMTIGADVAGTKTWDDKAITAKVGYTDLSPYMALVPQKDQWPSAPKMLEGSMNYRQKTAKDGLFKFYAAYNNSFFNVKQANINDAQNVDNYALTNNNYFANTHWNGILNNKWGLKLGGSFTHDKDHILINGNRLNKSLLGTHIKSKLSYYASDKMTIKFGADYQFKSVEQSFEELQLKHTNKYKENRTALFAEADVYLSTQLVLRGGLRLAYGDLNGQTKLTPRISGAYKFSPNSQVSLAYGQFAQNAKDNYLLYAPKLDQERANHYMLNYQYDKKKRNLRAEIYYKDYKKLVKTKGLDFYLPHNYDNTGKGYAYGFDFYFRDKKTIKNGDYWVSYGYVESKRDYRDFTQLQTPSFVSKHNLSLVYKHWIPNIKSFVSSTFQISSPRLYTDPNFEGTQNASLKPYKSFNLSWTYLPRQNLIFYASIKNVLGFENEFGYTFADNPNDEGIYAKQAIQPSAPRFFFLGCFLTLSKDKTLNQLDKIDL